MLYAGMTVSIDPDQETFVGPFDSPLERAQWCKDTLPSGLRGLNEELRMGVRGITVNTRFIDADGPLGRSIKPADAIRVIRNLYHDIYVAQ